MKLLFDQNLSFKLCGLLEDVFPGSVRARRAGLAQAENLTIWRYAGANGFTLVTLDADFADMAALLGPPPKVVWLRRGNQSVAVIAQMLRDQAEAIAAFETDEAVCFEIY